MSKKSNSQWLLRFQSPSHLEAANSSSQETSHQNQIPATFPILAKFSDPIDWKNLTTTKKDGMHMYFQDEELKEDENDEEIVKDAEYFKKKRAQQRMKRYYRKKQLLVFECPSEKLFYEGKENNLDVSELERTQTSTTDSAIGGTAHSDFRYVLFKFVKAVREDGEEVPEIQVIPVSSMYTLRKTGKFKDILLSEIEEKYIEGRKKLQKQLSKYRAIVNSLQRDRESDGREGDSRSSGKLDYVEEISDTDLFKQALQKAFGHRLAKLKGNQRKGRRASGGNDSSGIIGEDRDGNGNDGDHGEYVQINEVGIDMDELKEFAYCGGDYEKNFADDEEDNVTYEQMTLDANAASEISSSWRNDHLAESSEEDDEDEEDGKEGKSEGTSSGETSGNKSGSVNQFMLDEVDEAMEQYKQTVPAKSALKRTRDSTPEKGEELEYEITNDNEGLVESNTRKNAFLAASLTENKEIEGGVKEKKRARFAETAENDLRVVVPTIPAVLTASASATSKEFELTDEGIKNFIISRGGMVEIKVLSEAFKAKTKAYSKARNDKSAGKGRLLDIVDRITVTIEDPIRGPCLSLKTK